MCQILLNVFEIRSILLFCYRSTQVQEESSYLHHRYVITSYSIHYTKLYEYWISNLQP